MENQNATEIICILDKSGSMSALQQEIISGLNSFIREQQALEGLCNFTLVQFNQNVSVSQKRVPMQEVRELRADGYRPGGYTALYDAIGTTLTTAIETLFYLPAHAAPIKVLVFIITDGQENASRTYNKVQVKAMIENLTVNKGWEFQFYGANIDSFSEAENIGIASNKAGNWDFNEKGMEAMMKELSLTSAKFRKG